MKLTYSKAPAILKHHATGTIERGEKTAIKAIDQQLPPPILRDLVARIEARRGVTLVREVK